MTDPVKGPVAYLDANLFIDFLEGEAELAEAAREMLVAFEPGDAFFVTSELTLAEVLAPARLTPELRGLYLELLIDRPSIQLAPVSRDILIAAADLHRTTGQKLPDAIHLATAIDRDCAFLVSRDRHLDKTPPGGPRRLAANPENLEILRDAFLGR